MPEIISREALAALWRDPRQGISEDAIVCLVCGGVFRHLTNTHLAQHGLTSESYKEIVGYNGRRSLMAHAVRRLHAANAVRQGLAQMIRRRPIVADPTLRARGGTRRRAREEWLSRREIGRHEGLPPARDANGRFVAAEAAVVAQLGRRQSPSR
jgi:hypothetical protein